MSEVNLDFRFSSKKCEDIFFCQKRNIGVNGGFGSGKTYVGIQKLLALLTKFPGYRVAIGRYSSTDLKKTTMQTFYKVCPPDLFDPQYGGKVVEAPVPYTQLINGSRIYWIYLDKPNETSVRSLEINSALIDQCEEVEESTYIELDNRVGRWDVVTIPDDLLKQYPKWPRNKFTGKPLAPAYHIVLFNPPDEGEFSYLYERFHPDSPVHQKLYRSTHQYFQLSSRDNKALPGENLDTLLTRDEEWQNRFIEGNFSRGEGAIHSISPSSILDIDSQWVKNNLIKRANLTRVLDHGASAPTCCTWWASVGGLYFCYREYYISDEIISTHRRNIVDLSQDEYYTTNFADPSIFRKELEKYGGFWSTAQEYSDESLEAPPIYWSPADNNEFATRNRINELLKVNPDVKHPVSGKDGAPRLFFIRQSSAYTNGCHHIIRETASQKKKLLAEVNGRRVYSDDRAPSVEDHAYDTLRYYCASHLAASREAKPKPRPNSFLAAVNRIKALKAMQEGYYR
jgi:hypothetical protein